MRTDGTSECWTACARRSVGAGTGWVRSAKVHIAQELSGCDVDSGRFRREKGDGRG